MADYDAIIVGARCAGAPTAMLLARAGYKVLLLDKSHFPSDRLSTHYIQPSGVKHLERWGLLPAVAATNAPRIDSFTVFQGDEVIAEPPLEGPAYCPRRYHLDWILVRAAVEAGVELCMGSRVESLTREGERVTGVRVRSRDGTTRFESAPIVIGADGQYSLVARLVDAPKYQEENALTGGYYSYWSEVSVGGAEVHLSERGGVLVFPTNDGRVCIAAGRARSEFDAYRRDVEGTFFWILDAAPKLSANVRAGKREERWAGTGDLPNYFRKPWGPGWALVGDAGYVKDPVTGFGITDAFRDAELLTDALEQAWQRHTAVDDALSVYQSRRDSAALPIYEATLRMARGEAGA